MLLPGYRQPDKAGDRTVRRRGTFACEILIGNSTGIRSAVRAIVAVLLAFLVTSIPILLSGKSPLVAYGSLLNGAFGSVDHIAFALNKSTPYILIAVGVALCFRAGIINIGGEGQVAVGALADVLGGIERVRTGVSGHDSWRSPAVWPRAPPGRDWPRRFDWRAAFTKCFRRCY